jgi:hypothetical protein
MVGLVKFAFLAIVLVWLYMTNRSEASKLRIGKTPSERSRKMADLARIRYLKMTPRQRKMLMKKMLLARWNKNV